MNIGKLEWDSEFFGLNIGKAEIYTKEDSVELTSLHDSLEKEYDLLYVFDSLHIGFNADGANLVDEKVLYSKTCEQRLMSSDVMRYTRETPSKALYHLSHVSGLYSRFNLDKKFPRGSFERLYDRWIENACPKTGTDKQIFVYCPEGIAKGMITVNQTPEGLAHIGLVSVDTDCQGTGVGTKIMQTVEDYLFNQGNVHTLEVPTQKRNTNACRWYEKNGFKVASVIDIYHWWL